MNGLSLCSGIGALDDAVGLLHPEYRPVGFVERDAFCAAALVERMESATLAPAPIWDDATTFDGRPWRGVVDSVTAGFPCQPWSSAGKHRGVTDDRWIWADIGRIIAESEPRAVYLENVEGVVRRGGLASVLADLAALGFDATWDVFSAARVGAPHRRRRLYVVARRVSNADRERLRFEPKRGRGAARPANPGNPELGYVGANNVADTDSQRGPQSTGHPSGGRCNPDARSAEKPVADTDRSRQQGVGQPMQGRRHYGALGDVAHGCDLSLWPPACDDLHAWRRLPPESQPAVCRLVDGAPAYRCEWLHAIGNSVCPLAAAYAFRALEARLA